LHADTSLHPFVFFNALQVLVMKFTSRIKGPLSDCRQITPAIGNHSLSSSKVMLLAPWFFESLNQGTAASLNVDWI